MDIFFDVIKHNEISEAKIAEIVALKSEHWKYSVESQIAWINKTFEKSDCHILMFVNDKLAGYVGVNHILVEISGTQHNYLGIGNVCISKKIQGKGYGKTLVEKVNELLLAQKAYGILLCKDSLVKFYMALNWKMYNYSKAIVAGELFTHNIMVFNSTIANNSNIVIPKKF